MSPIWWSYFAVTALVEGLFLAPLAGLSSLLGEESAEFRQRLGNYPTGRKAALSLRLWMHAASMGEVSLACGLLEGLVAAWPNLSVVLSTDTKTGRHRAEKICGHLAEVVYFPFDSYFSVRRALGRLRPDCIVLLETELWPIFICQALGSGAKIALVNGRISDRSAPAYKLLAPFFRPLLNQFNLVAARTEKDAARLRGMGAPADRMVVTGDAKPGSLAFLADPDEAERLSLSLGLKERPVWVAGSVRQGEEKIIISAFEIVRREVPEAVLVFAPRHLNRIEPLARAFGQAGLHYESRSSLNGSRSRRAPVVILDTMGELFNVYQSAQVALSGGSLVPLGGQNPLEPAHWGVPVLFGPYMDDFSEAAAQLISNGGARRVKSAPELAEQVINLLTDPELRNQMGQQALMTCQELAGAARQTVNLILDLLGEEKAQRAGS